VVREVERPSRSLRALASTTGVSDEFGEATTQGLLTDVHAAATAPQEDAAAIVQSGGLSRDSMRRAIILSELLAPPVAIREGF